MKLRVLLTLTALLSGVAHGQSQYLAGNISRTYYLGELETCPGKLDLQVGDLWTLTFPQPIADSFVTRDGLVERKVIDNRMIIAVTGSGGSTPALVLTEDGKAPRFDLTITPGPGNRNKNVVIKQGFPAKPTPCNLSQISVASPEPNPLQVTASTTRIVAVSPSAINTPQTAVVSPPKVVKVTPATPTPVRAAPATLPAPVVRPPAVSAQITTPKITTPRPATSTWITRTQPPLTPVSPTVPAQVLRPVTPPPVPVTAPVRQDVRVPIQVQVKGPEYLKTTLQFSDNGLNATFVSTLDADISFDTGTLQFGNARAKYPNPVLVPAGGKVEFNIPLEGALPVLLADFRLDGSIVGSGEPVLLRELVKL